MTKKKPASTKKPVEMDVPASCPKPVGEQVAQMPPGTLPDLRPLFGRWVNLEPLSPKHAEDLYQSFASSDPDGGVWTYMGYGPFASQQEFGTWLGQQALLRDPWFYALVPRHSQKASGMGAFMRADAKHGVIEIGHIWMAPGLQRTREATEAIYLFMRHAFDELGVRRLEWKCDHLNAPSRKAALRFGFTFEGIFRQHFIIKGRNRDTAWYSIIDTEWPALRQGFEDWLRDDNFDAAGQQKARLHATKQAAIQRASKTGTL